jgi:hypothetical protein
VPLACPALVHFFADRFAAFERGRHGAGCRRRVFPGRVADFTFDLAATFDFKEGDAARRFVLERS